MPADTATATTTPVHPRFEHRMDATAGGYSLLGAVTQAARLAGIEPMPWQRHSTDVITAVDETGRWLHPEAVTVVARQNGKTTMITPRVTVELIRGSSVAHAAHDRTLARKTFLYVANLFETIPELAAVLAAKPRRANGQESLETITGGVYAIYSSQTEAIRGSTNDLVIIDETRELTTEDFTAAAEPTTLTSTNPQTWYLSNAGHAGSVILNRLRHRAENRDPDLAYLEWSVPAEADIDDEALWHMANPAIGHTVTLDRLRQLRRSLDAPVFDTEHLCRWVTTDTPTLLDAGDWDRCRVDELEQAGDTSGLGVAVDPVTGRVSAVVAWLDPHGRINLQIAADLTPPDLAGFADELVDQALTHRINTIGVNPWTDGDLTRHLGDRLDVTPITGRELAGAAQLFTGAVRDRRIRHLGDETLSLDVKWTGRRTRPDGTAVPVRGDRPVTGILAAVNAAWIATNPSTGPVIY